MSTSQRPPKAAVPGRADATAAGAGGEGETILICEDEPSLRELVRAVLGPGYRYVEAVDGTVALELVQTTSPDLVILDLMLPYVSGFEVLTAIRANPELRNTPVVVLTAWSHVQAEAEAIGADRFVAKPFQ